MAYPMYNNGYPTFLPPQNQAVQPVQPIPAMNNMNQGAYQTGYLCRPVTSREEAVAAETSYFSPGTLMPDLAHEVVYLKRFNPNSGGSDFFTYVLKEDEPEPKIEYASTDDVLRLREIIDSLRDEIETLKKPAEPRRYSPSDKTSRVVIKDDE